MTLTAANQPRAATCGPTPENARHQSLIPVSSIKSLSYCLAFLCIALLGIRAHAADPLGLTAGVAADKVLGALANSGNFNTSSYPGNIAYSSAALTTRNFNVRLPSGYDPNNPAKKYGLVCFIDFIDTPVFPAAYAAALDAHDVIWIAPHGCGNTIGTPERSGAAVMGAFRMTELYNIDPARIYASGLSGGSRVSSELTYLRNDFFRGFIGRVGAGLPELIPDFSVGGNLTDAATYNDEDGGYEYFFVWAGQPSVVLPLHFRTALISQYGDFRRAEILGIYRYGHLNHGNTARMIMRPGGHSDINGPSFTEALDLMYHPLVDVVWDRFENNFLPANVQSGKTVAGSGFTAISGNVSETGYSYNSATHGVLKLTGDGAAAKSNDTFTWKNNYGILLDARLRAENATTPGQNQQIGVHIVPAGTTGAAASQPGFHIYWCYGQPYRAEIVSADGTRKTLATWEHTAAHPMNAAATDKMFWDSTAAPDYAGRSKSFRGEDVRLSLNSAGFQLTFNRPAVNLTTSYPDKVVTASNVAANDDPAASPNESLPMIIQGFWNEVETALVNGLPGGDWQLIVSNDAIAAGQPVGNALVDEIHLIGSTGAQAAPATLAVTAPANTTRSLTWTQIHGAMAYVIERATSPDGLFVQVASVSNTLKTYSDTVPSNTAYYYRVGATGSDGTTGNWSPIAFAKRNPSLPASPTAPAVTYPAVYQARVAWSDSAINETGYRIERSPAGYAQWTLVSGQLAAGSISFTDSTVLSGASYDYRISAINADGLSGYASVTASVPDATPPAPTGVSATATYASVDLTWNAVPQAASYRVKRADSPGGPYTTIASDLTSPAYADASFTPGATHYYLVSAVSGSGLLASNSAEISIAALILLPPTDLTVTPGFTFNTLNWTAATGAGGYSVLRSGSADGPFETIATGITATTCTDSALVTGTPYFYIVRTASGSIQSDPTTAAGGTPVPGTTTKANNTSALDQADSWTNNILPTVYDTARWDGAYTVGGVAGIGAGLAVNGIQIAAPSTSVSITAGTGALTLGAGGIDLTSATQSFTSFAPVVLAAPQSWTVASNRIVQINAPVSDAGAGRGININGPGSVVLASDNTYTGTTAVSAGTLHLGASAGSTNGSLAGPVNLGGGIFRVNRTDACSPIGGAFTATAGNFQLAQATGVVTLNAINLPAGSTNTFASLTGTAGATLIVDAHPSASLAFGGSTAGINAVVKNGNVTFTTASSGFNFRIEGGGFIASASLDRFQLAATNGTQTFQIAGGAVDLSKVTAYGLRVGGSGSATQTGAQNVSAAQSAGSLLVSFCTIGGTDTAANKNPSFTLSGGTFTATSTNSNALQIGADTAGLGTSTFSLSGTGKLVIPGTISGAQSGARQVFSFTGGTLAAGTINFSNLRSSAGGTNNVLIQSGGTLAPGDDGVAGRTAITGQYTLGADATLSVDIGGTTQASAFQTGQYDYLSVTGTASLGGQLRVALMPGFVPSNAAAFTIVNASTGLTGAFANAAFNSRVTTAGGEGSFLVTQAGNTVRLSDYRSSLESWRLENFGATANAGAGADLHDADGDGLGNLLEYALGSSPGSAASAERPVLGRDGTHLTLTFFRAHPELNYVVEAGSQPSGGVPLATNPGAAGTQIKVTDPVEIGTPGVPARFLRLRVTAP